MSDRHLSYASIHGVGRLQSVRPLAARLHLEVFTGLVLLAGDIAAIGLGAVAAGAAATVVPITSPFAAVSVVAVILVCVNLLFVCGAYQISGLHTANAHFSRLLPAVCGLAAYALLLGQVAADDAANGAWLTAWAATGPMLLVSFRLAAHGWLIGRGHARDFARHVVVVGERSLVERVVARLEAAEIGAPTVHVAGQVELAVLDGQDEAFAAGIARITRLIEREVADTVLLALPWHDEAVVQRTMERLGELAVEVFLVSDLVKPCGRRIPPSWFGGIPCLMVIGRPLAGWETVAKDVFDRLLAGAALVLLSPLLLLTIAAIRLDSPGPAFFRQKRQGLNGQVFEIFKFRSMCVDRCDDGTGSVAQASRRDPRITRVGRWLRRTSLDELPQLLNVLRGEMSIVGPRPHAVAHNQHYARLIDRYAARHRMKPGITGWAQVHGYRGETDTLEKMMRRVEHDLAYIERWSLVLDIQIVLRTLLVGFVHPEAR